jgi:hypothetical protein
MDNATEELPEIKVSNEDYQRYMETSDRYAFWLARVEEQDGVQAARIAARALIGAAVLYTYSGYGPDIIRDELEKALRCVETAVHASNGVGISTEVH